MVKNLVLAHQIDHAIRHGRARNYKALAQQMDISDARIGPIVGLCQLAPEIQEQNLNGDARTLEDLSPRQLSKIARSSIGTCNAANSMRSPRTLAALYYAGHNQRPIRIQETHGQSPHQASAL